MDQISLLKKLGFTEYEARAYLSLAKLGSVSVREVVRDSKLPRNKAYEALQRLEEKGKVVSMPLSPKVYKIVDPEVFNDEIDNMKKRVEDLIKIIEQPKTKEYKEFFWILKGRKSIHDKFALENSKVDKELLICHNISKSYPKNIRAIKECVERGVKVKIITLYEERCADSYKIWKKAGAEIRFFNQKRFGALQRISVFDSKKASMVIGSPEIKSHEDQIMLWSESKILANMLKNYFNTLWKQSKK